jgi:hypothetical protein
MAAATAPQAHHLERLCRALGAECDRAAAAAARAAREIADAELDAELASLGAEKGAEKGGGPGGRLKGAGVRGGGGGGGGGAAAADAAKQRSVAKAEAQQAWLDEVGAGGCGGGEQV